MKKRIFNILILGILLFLSVMQIPFDMDNPIYNSQKLNDNKYVSLAIEKLAPTNVYYWRIYLSYAGDVDGTIEFRLNNKMLSNNWLKIFKFKIIRFNQLDENSYDENTLSSIEVYSGRISSNEDYTIFYGLNDGSHTDIVYCASNAVSSELKCSSVSYLFQIEILTYKELLDNGVYISYNDYHSLQDSNFISLSNPEEHDDYFFEVVLSSRV